MVENVNVELRVSPVPEIAGSTVQIEVRAFGNVARMDVYNMDHIIYTVNGNSGSFSWVVEYGEVKIIVRAYDPNGNMVGTAEFPRGEPIRTRDGIPPKLNIKFVPSEDLIEPNDEVEIRVEVKDEESGVDTSKVYLYVDGERVKLENFSFSGGTVIFTYEWIAIEGEHEFYAIGYDVEGNMGLTNRKRLMIGLDDIPPSVVIDSLDTVQPNSPFTVDVYAFDSGSGIRKLRMTDSYGNTFEDDVWPPQTQFHRRYDLIAGEEGIYSVVIEAEDNMGNRVEERKDVRITVNKPPHITLECPKQANQGETVRATADAWDEDGEIIRVEFYIDDVMIDSIEHEPYVVSWVAETGKHVVRAVAYDDAGNVSAVERSIYVVSGPPEEDNNPPVILFEPEDRHPLGELRNLVALVSDDSEVDEVALLDDGEFVSNGIPISGDVYRLSWTPTRLGTHTLTVVATDIFGNSDSVFSYVEVLTPDEYRKPVITSFYVNKHMVGLGDEVNVTVGAKDDRALDYADLYVRCGDDERRVDSERPEGGYTFNLRWIADCLYTTVPIKVVVYDVDGYHTEATDVLNVFEAPIVEFVHPEPPGTSVVFRRDPPVLITLIASVTDPSSPSSYSFDITGPKDEKLIPIMSGSGGKYIFMKDWTPSEPGRYNVDFNYENEIHIHVVRSITIEVLPQTSLEVLVNLLVDDILRMNPSVATVVARNYDTGKPAEDAMLAVEYSNGQIQVFTNPMKLGNGIFVFNFPLVDDPDYEGPAVVRATATVNGQDGGTKKDVIVDLREPRISLNVQSDIYLSGIPVFSDPFKLNAEVENVSFRDVDEVSFSMDGIFVERIPGNTPKSTSSGRSAYETDWIDPGTFDEGFHRVVATVVDLGGNIDFDEATILFDLAPPTVLEYWIDDQMRRGWDDRIYGNSDSNLNVLVGDSIVGPDSGYVPELHFRLGSVIYVVESGDLPANLSSTETVYRKYDYSSILPKDDIYELSFTVKDKCGNSTEVNVNFFYDTHPPTLVFMKPNHGAKVGQNGTEIVVHVDDNLSGLLNFGISSQPQNMGNVQPTSSDISNDGLHATLNGFFTPSSNLEEYVKLISYATDQAMNLGESSITIFVDTKEPRIKILKPLESSILASDSTEIEVHATDLGEICSVSSESNFGTLIMLVDPPLPSTVTTVSGTITGLTNLETDVIITVKMVDCLGNEASSSRSFFVDTLAPRIKKDSTSCTCSTHATVNLVLLDLSDISTIVATWTDKNNSATSMKVEFENGDYEHSVVMTATLTTDCSTPATVELYIEDEFNNSTESIIRFEECE